MTRPIMPAPSAPSFSATDTQPVTNSTTNTFQPLRRARSEAHLAEMERELTFAPAINARSDKLLLRSGQPLDFMERQKVFQQQLQNKRAQMTAALQDKECRCGGGDGGGTGLAWQGALSSPCCSSA
jgi:hypothetical protein